MKSIPIPSNDLERALHSGARNLSLKHSEVHDSPGIDPERLLHLFIYNHDNIGSGGKRIFIKNWLLSLHGAITLSVLAFLAFSGRLFMDWRYESYLMGAAGSTEEFFSVLLFLAFLGIYIWGMLAAIGGSRRGLIALLIVVLLLNIGFALATYFSWCPPASCTNSPGLWLWNWIHLILGLLAAISLGFQLTRKKPTS